MSGERRIGEALKAVVSEAYESREIGATHSALMNNNRRRVFEYLAWHPASTAAEIARALAVSEPTVAWHLRKLTVSEYIVGPLPGRPARYCVAGLNLDPPEVATLAVIADGTSARVLTETIATPGLTGGQLAKAVHAPGVRRAIRDLLAANLIVLVVDGRYRRYYPGAATSALERNAARRLREFRRRFLLRLERDLLSPQAHIAPGDMMEITVRFGGERATIRVPVASLLAGRLG